MRAKEARKDDDDDEAEEAEEAEGEGSHCGIENGDIRRDRQTGWTVADRRSRSAH